MLFGKKKEINEILLGKDDILTHAFNLYFLLSLIKITVRNFWFLVVVLFFFSLKA